MRMSLKEVMNLFEKKNESKVMVYSRLSDLIEYEVKRSILVRISSYSRKNVLVSILKDSKEMDLRHLKVGLNNLG